MQNLLAKRLTLIYSNLQNIKKTNKNFLYPRSTTIIDKYLDKTGKRQHLSQNSVTIYSNLKNLTEIQGGKSLLSQRSLAISSNLKRVKQSQINNKSVPRNSFRIHTSV